MSLEQRTVLLEEDEEEEEETSNSPGTWDDYEEDDDDGEPKICRACGDKATGYHFNAMTCEGCKGFFRRAMKRNLRLSCPFQNSCVINRNNRRHCQACRLKKCLDIGMRKELIMSDEAVKVRRALIRKKQMLVHFQSVSPNPGLTEEQRSLVEQLAEAQKKTFDSNFAHFNNFRPIRRHMNLTDFSQHSSSPHVFTMLPHISDLVTYVIEGVISFAKIVPRFRTLSIEDQIALLKGSALEMAIIRFNTPFNPKTCSWECGKITYNLRDMALAGFRQIFLEPLIRFHCMLKKLNLNMEEYALMQAICLFSSDRPGVTDRENIDRIQEHLALTLMSHIEAERQSQEYRFLFAKIMECLTEMRTVSDEHSRQVLHIWDIQPGYTPLLLEVFSKVNDE